MRGGGYRPEGGCRAGLSPEEPPADCGLGPITVVSAVQPCPVGENSDATILSHLFSEVMCSQRDTNFVQITPRLRFLFGSNQYFL